MKTIFIILIWVITIYVFILKFYLPIIKKMDDSFINCAINIKEDNEEFEKGLFDFLKKSDLKEEEIKEKRRNIKNEVNFITVDINAKVNKKFKRSCQICGATGTFTHTCTKLDHKKICSTCNMVINKIKLIDT
jgi:hypothetical protein